MVFMFSFLNSKIKKCNFCCFVFILIVLPLLLTFTYAKLYIYLNKDVVYEVRGKFGGVLVLRGDSRKKKIILIERDEQVLRFPALLSDVELSYLKGYSGDVAMVYKKSPFGTVWIKELKLDGKVFERN